MDQEIRRCDGCKAVWYHLGINDSLYRWLMFRLDRKKWTFDETQCLTFHYLQDKCANVHMKGAVAIPDSNKKESAVFYLGSWWT